MYTLVKEQLIIEFLSYYGIDYTLLSLAEKSNVVLLSNILFLLFLFISFYILYRVLANIFR